MIRLGLLLLVLAAPPLAAQADSAKPRSKTSSPADSAKPKAKKPSTLKAILGAVADTVGTAAGATLLDTLSGGAGKAVGNRMGAGAGGCPPGYVAASAPTPGGTMGGLVIGAAKRAAKAARAAADTAGNFPATPEAAPAPQCVPAGAGYGMTPEQAAMQQQGGQQAPGGINPAMLTPVGAAITAAPLAIEGGKAAAKGVKKMFGLNPKTWQQMLAEYGEKGLVELKGVKFIAATTELEEGGDAVIEQAAEAIAKARYPVSILVEPEAAKGEDPDPELATQRREKLGAMLLAAGAPESKFTPGAIVPEKLIPKEAKTAKLGESRVFLVRVKDAP